MFGICDNNEQEWLYLVMEAKELGLTVEEVRRFIAEADKQDT